VHYDKLAMSRLNGVNVEIVAVAACWK